MSTPNTLESFTLLTTMQGSCGCGCDDSPFVQMELPQSNTVRLEEESIQPQESRTGDGTGQGSVPGI